MPMIEAKVTMELPAEKRDVLKTEFGNAISIMGKPESYLISASIDGVPIDGFSYDKFSYDQLDFIYEDIVFSFQASIGATVECRHYTNNQNLTLLVKGYDNYCKTDDTIIKNEQEYVFMFKPNTRLNSLGTGLSKRTVFSVTG